MGNETRRAVVTWAMYVLFVGAAAVNVWMTGWPTYVQLAVVVGAAALAMSVELVRARRRAGGLRAMQAAAQRMLEAGLVSNEVIRADVDLPKELVPLAQVLNDVRIRVRGQIKEVAKKSRNLEALIDAMDEPLLATDSNDRVILNSRSAEAMLDVPPGGLIGRGVSELFTQAEIIALHQAAKTGQTRRDRIRIVTPLGKRTLQVSAAPVPAAWGQGVFGAVLVLRDVTELDHAVQVKTDFVANASHELRTPVAAIRSAAETLEAAGDDPEMAAKLRGMIVAHAERLQEMLRDLLDLSRLESPDAPLKIEAVDMGELVRTLRQLSEHACTERNLTLSFELDEELTILRTDRKLLALILRNLVENATKFAFEGTTIRVSGTLVEFNKSASPGEGIVRFEVADKGVGIPLQQQERVFERYYQVDPARTGTGSAAPTGSSWKRGTGLGLAIVKHAVKALHGRCVLTSVWGQGTTVTVEIPVGLGEG